MAATANPTYLKLRKRTWWLNLPIPSALQRLYQKDGQKPPTHKRESLRTRDIDVANERKYARIAFYKREFAAKARQAAGTLASDIREAYEIRGWVNDANSRDAETYPEEDDQGAPVQPNYEAVADHIAERAHDIRGKAGADRARRFVDLATRIDTPTLRTGFAMFIAQLERNESTKRTYQHAFEELLSRLKIEDAMPDEITDRVAADHVRWLNTEAQSKKGGPLAYNTKSNRLVGLSSYWNYLGRVHLIRKGNNPWHGHELTGQRKAHKGDKMKRPWTHAEMLALFNGPERPHGRTHYTKRTICELAALCFYTGARIDEMCSRTVGDFERVKGALTMHIRTGKNDASLRSLPIVDPIPLAVIKRRIGKRTDPNALLFSELRSGGYDKKQSWQVDKAANKYRRVDCGIPREADFHGTRRTLLSVLSNAGAPAVWANWYAGHTAADMTNRVYTKAEREAMIETAKMARYPAKIERAMSAALGL